MTSLNSSTSSPLPQALDVLTVGHALVDVFANASDEFLSAEGLEKGSMHLIDETRAHALYERMGPGSEASGGSAANTATGVVACGGSAAFLGTVADDQLGHIFEHDLRAAGVVYRTPPLAAGPATGRSLILVTADGERTMNTFLGAGGCFGVEHLDADLVRASAITYVEGYMLDTENAGEALARTVSLVREAGHRFALTLSDLFCVDRHREAFHQLLQGSVDICFGNDEEACALMETEDLDAAIDELARRCEVVAITRGARGSVVACGNRRIDIPAIPAEVVDTTGAGDFYAAGVLAGLARGLDLATCGQMGSIAASQIIAQIGARLRAPLRLS